MNPDQLIQILESVFKSSRPQISRNHNDKGRDTDSLTLKELKKEFIFDANSGSYLGCIDTQETHEIEHFMSNYTGHMPQELASELGIIGNFLAGATQVPVRVSRTNQRTLPKAVFTTQLIGDAGATTESIEDIMKRFDR
jgi:hypothetical protein